MRKLLSTIAAVGIALSAGTAMARDINVGTGGPTGNYYSMGNDIKYYCEGELSPDARSGGPVGLNIMNSGGSVDNLVGMGNKEYSVGIVQQDVLQYMAKRDGNRVNQNRIKVITGMHAETIHLLIPKGYEPKSDDGLLGGLLSKFDDILGSGGDKGIDVNLLKDQRVGSWGGSMVSAKALSLFLNLNLDVVEVPEEQRATVRMPLVLVGGQPYQPVQDYLSTGDWHLVGLDYQLIQNKAPFYLEATANYQVDGRLQDIPTVGVRALMVGKSFRNPNLNQHMSELATCITQNLADLADDPQTNPNWGSVYEFENSGQQVNWQYFPMLQ